MEQQKFPTEMVELPSQGKLYSPDSPLASGKIEMKYMTAREEDILTNQNYIANGTVIDKLLQALIVDKTVDYGSLLAGDKNAILIGARILGYGKDYSFQYNGVTEEVDLSLLEAKPLHETVAKATKNEFEFTTPATGRVLTFKLLTHKDEQGIEAEVKGLKKLNKESSAELSTRLKHMIIAVDGNADRAAVRSFVDNEFLARDSREFRKHLTEIQPDIDMTFYPENGPDGGVQVPIGVNFLWPDATV